MTEPHDEHDSTTLPVVPASCVLAVIAGGLLLCSQLTLTDATTGFFPVGQENFDGDQLFDPQFRLMFVLWPVLALSLSIFGALRESAAAISVGLGALMLTASYGLSLLVGYIDVAVGDGVPAGVLSSTVYIVGALSIAAAATATWWIVVMLRRSTAGGRTSLWRVAAMVALAVSMVASIVSVLRFRSEFDFPLLPPLVALFFAIAAIAALATGTNAGAAFAVAAVAARLAETFDLLVVRGIPFSLVAETTADKLTLVALTVALICSLIVVFPSLSSVRSNADSLRSKLALADEWDD